MMIQEFRVVLRAADFETTRRFYANTLALPRLRSWQNDRGQGALFRAGGGMIEVRGRPRGWEGRRGSDEFSYRGPLHKLTLTLEVPSAEEAYENLLLREPNIPGGLRELADGRKAFDTHDPDGVRIRFQEAD